MSFKEKWVEAVKNKNSVLCAGLDPAEFDMGRGESGLSQGADKREWAINYVKAVAPYCAAVKPNSQYWKGENGAEVLKEIYDLANELGLVVIEDSKLADIGPTNDAGFFFTSKRADAVTFSPFAGNMSEAAEQGKKRGIGVIAMCLMSNPEYKNEKNKLVESDDSYKDEDMINLAGKKYVKQYVQLANNANRFNISGIVIGAPSPDNHIQEEEIKKARSYAGEDMLVLLPGVGAQGGEADAIWKFFGPDKVIVNVGRGLMFPNGSDTTPEQQAETAKHYQEMLNELRFK
ncbi:MAG: orotidine-5'-phosphate decarboxylase [Candidatus Woesearchaeota archaeon]